MIFSFDRPEIPVDTHVHRVGGRLGLFRSNASWDEAHDEMLRVTPPEDAYELHVNLITPRPRALPARAAEVRRVRASAHVPLRQELIRTQRSCGKLRMQRCRAQANMAAAGVTRAGEPA